MKFKPILLFVILIILVLVIWLIMTSQPVNNINIKNDSDAVIKSNDLIIVSSPTDGQIISSPVRVIGQARGYWFFEASFPIIIKDANGNIIGEGLAQAQNDWMTGDFVPFKSSINFLSPATTIGEVILKKDNPSGLPEHDAEIRVPVRFIK